MTEKINIEEITKLQEKYLKFCEDNLLNDSKIHDFCKDAQDEINKNYEDLYTKTTRPNLISTPFERLVTFRIISYFLKKNINIKLFPSIISSDLIFELDDCFINIDCKTVNIIFNAGDAKDISVSPNQMTFSCDPLYKINFEDGQIFSGFHYEGKQKPVISNKPNFTFMFKLVYADNYKNKDKRLDIPGENVGPINNALNVYSIKTIDNFKKRFYQNLALAIAIVPNGHLADAKFIKDGMQGFKNYDYITSERNYPSEYKPLNEKKDYWKEIKLKEYFPGPAGPTKKIFLDPELKHPDYPNEQAVWGILGKKYCIMLGGLSGRINRELTIFKKIKL